MLKAKNPKIDNLHKTRKLRLTSDFSLGHHGGWGGWGWGGCIKNNENHWKFLSYKGTNLGYDMLCQSVNSDQDEKEGDLLNSYRIINLNNLIKNIDKLFA